MFLCVRQNEAFPFDRLLILHISFRVFLIVRVSIFQVPSRMAFDDNYNDSLEVDEPVNVDIEVTESSDGKRRFAGAGDTAKNVAKTLGLGLLNSINPFATILGYVVIVKVVADEIKWHRNVSFPVWLVAIWCKLFP